MTAGRFVSVVAAVLLAVPGFARAADTPGTPDRAVLDRYCLGCHSVGAKAGNFVLEGLDPARASGDVESWEKVVRKLRGGLMPPPGRPRPDAPFAPRSNETWIPLLPHTPIRAARKPFIA